MTVTAHADDLLSDTARESRNASDPFASSLAPRIAVLIPCYNEAATVATVVADFYNALPTATVYVYDNNSVDETRRLAARGGRDRANRAAPRQG